MIHIDLFSGIGGFSYAADQVWNDVEHIFCEIDPFCQQVLKKHWKGSVIYGDIRELIADAARNRLQEPWTEKQATWNRQFPKVDLLTGGFPCQPFSQAGKRKGTNDDRHLWPKMLRVIQLTKPTWVVAENVRGLLTIEGGVVFEQVCLDLEREGYEVQAFIIPACAVNAPHRRDRVWIVANKFKQGLQGWAEKRQGYFGQQNRNGSNQRRNWNQNWLKVATELCGVDDGLPFELDGLKLSKAKHRVERLKALGNSIVPQVAVEIFRGMVG